MARKIKMIYKEAVIVFVAMAIFVAGGESAAGMDDMNIAPRCRVLVSPAASSAWNGEQLVDNDIGPTKGWLGRREPDSMPWIRMILPIRANVKMLRVMAASYTEVEQRRFARPKKIRVLVKADEDEVFDFVLEDVEERFQDLKLEVDDVTEISILIDDVYTHARYPGQVGFQEIQIISPPETFSVPLTPGFLSEQAIEINDHKLQRRKIMKEMQAVNEEGGKKKQAKKSGKYQNDENLSTLEKEILDLLGQLLEKLEQKFRED